MLIFSGSDRGLVRSQNEDYHRYDRNKQLILIADGVGGQPFGEVASQIAVESAFQYLNALSPATVTGFEKELVSAVEFAHNNILTQQKIKKSYSAMGTTLLIAWLVNDVVYFSWAGDSRLYYFKQADQSLNLLSHDHTLLQEIKDKGSSIEGYEDSGNILTHWIGVEGKVNPGVSSQKVSPGDLLLACTDGLSDFLSSDELQNILIENKGDLSNLSMSLIRETYKKGARDNISSVVGLVP